MSGQAGSSIETSRPHPSEDGSVACTSCGRANPPGSQLCEGPRCRKTLPGNRISTRHGLYATAPPGAFEAEGAALFEQSVIDAGGRDELIARVLADHEYRAVIHIRIKKLAWALNHHGDVDRRGRMRTAWIARLESLINTAVSLDKTLGLERKAKRVDLARALSGLDR